MKHRARAIWILVCLACGFTVVSYNLIRIQLVDHDRYWRMAVKNHLYPERIDPVRGSIFDADGNLLAQSQTRTDLFLDGKLLDDPPKELAEVAGVLQVPTRQLMDRFVADKRHIDLANDLADDVAARLRGLKIKALIFAQHDERFYPNNDLASHILGYTTTPALTDLFADGGQLANPKEELASVAAILQIPEKKLLDGFDPANHRIYLAKALSDEAVTRLKALDLPGLIFDAHDERLYPTNEVASHGQMGIEKEMDSWLCGVPGQRWVERDGLKHEIAGYAQTETAAVEGCNVTLTIRMAIQHMVEGELDQIVQTYTPNAAYIIIMDPHTGEIMAMGSRPTFDPNEGAACKPENLRNRCISDPVEPGSVFKIITIAGALNEGMVNLNTPIDCEDGSFSFCGRTLHDDERNGTLPVIEVLAQSSNIGFAKIAIDYLHEQKLYQYARAFGIGQRTGLFTQQGESPGFLNPVIKWTPLSISRIPMGQEVSATPIQLATAMSVIANGGRLVVPHLVEKVTDASGQTVKTYPPQFLRQVISPETAREVARALEQVTIDGTAKNIHIQDANGDRHSYAGKTGTAQKYMVADHAYSHTKFVSSFIGFMPAKDPAFVALVMVDEPHTSKVGGYYGSAVSAPVFADMGRQMAQLLNLPPDLPPAAPVLTSNNREDR